MKWIINRIDESDFGCEERMPGQPLMVLVTLECEDGRECQFEVADDWLRIHDIDEGDEWPENVEAVEEYEAKINRMSDWMDGYYDALDEMDE